jgi:hypothetical protein
MTTKFQEKHGTVEAAIESAHTAHAKNQVNIILSQGEFYLEDADSVFVRNWETMVYDGLGKNAADYRESWGKRPKARSRKQIV